MLSTFILQLFGFFPIAPSRHQLVNFLPVALIASIFFGNYLFKNINNISFNIIYFTLILLTLYFQVFSHLQNSNLKFTDTASYLKMNGAQRIVLNNCDYELILNKEIRLSFDPIYSCGNKIIKFIPPDVNIIAVWSTKPINRSEVFIILEKYSKEKWLLKSGENYSIIGKCIDCSNLWFAVKDK
jgi:hypothetical protein